MAIGPVTFNGKVIVDPRKVAAVLNGPNGLAMKQLIQDGELVKREAKRLVHVSRPDPVPRKRPRVPGQLRASIVKRVVYSGTNPAVQVGSSLPYALWHHEGTQPHEIYPVKARFLVFYWAKAGRVVYVKRVHHPGTKPNRFLINALKVLGPKYRWRQT